MTEATGAGERPGVWLAGPEEAATVSALLIEFRDWLKRDQPDDASLRSSVERLLEEGEAEYLLAATMPGAPAAGVCQLRYRYGIWLSGEDCWLEDLFVRDSARRAGLGAALVEGAVSRAAARGCRRIELDTTSDNAAALALYGRVGFSATMPEGGTRLLLRRLLPEGG